MPRLAVADHDKTHASSLDVFVHVTQLRDLLAAKNSAEMPYENEQSGLIFPCVSDGDWIFPIIYERNCLQAFGGVVHDFTSPTVFFFVLGFSMGLIVKLEISTNSSLETIVYSEPEYRKGWCFLRMGMASLKTG